MECSGEGVRRAEREEEDQGRFAGE